MMGNLINRIYVVILFVACSTFSYSQKEINTQLFDDYFNQIENFNGNVLVAIDGKPIFSKSYGFANLELDVENNVDTKFCIGSLTKQFTSVAIFTLYEKGKLKLTDSISSYINNLPETWQSISIHQLLNHTSGLIHSFASAQFNETMSLRRTLDEVIESFYDKPLVASPGERVSYSGLGYFILAKIIENISGMSYGNYLEEEIFKKVGMNNTGAYNPSHIYKNIAYGYQMYRDNMRNADYIYLPILTGGGNLYSTIGDLLKWSQAFNSDLLIADSTKKIMLTPGFGNVACGIGIEQFKPGILDNAEKINFPDSLVSIGQGGWVPGFSSRMDMFPDKKVLIVKLSNGDYFDQMWDNSFTQLVLKEVYRRNK